MHRFHKKPSCAAVIVAAGSSSRMKGTDKVLYPLDGVPMLMHSVRVFQQCEKVSHIVIVTRQELIEPVRTLCNKYQCTKVTAVVPGGADRPHSVAAGLDHVKKGTKYVAVHDSARPFVTRKVIEDALHAAVKYSAAAPAVPVKDTIKAVKNRIVTATPERSSLYAVQTPQTFDFDLLRGALQYASEKGLSITDDCSAVEAMGMSVYLTDGDEENIKITTPLDLSLANAILEGRKSCG